MCVVAACSGAPRAVGTEPSWRHGQAPVAVVTGGPVTFAPSSTPSGQYNEPAGKLAPSPLGDAAIAAVRDAAAQVHVTAPIADPRLFAACNDLAAIVTDDGEIDYPLVEFALQRHGIIEPSPHLMVVWGPIDETGEIMRQLAPQLGPSLAAEPAARFGIGAVRRKPDGTGAVVFALQQSGLATAPMPRSLPAGGSFQIDAVIDAQYTGPEVFVTHDDGTTQQLAVQAGRSGGVKAEVACGTHRGRQEIEIAASGATGPAVLANFPVWCGAEPPASVTLAAARDDTHLSAQQAERQLFELVNRDRKAAGLPALVWDDRVAAVARAYSQEMRRTHVVAHVSPLSGSAADRVRAAGIKTAVVLENVARAYAVEEAHQGLMNSPGHRENILSTAATHVGIGVAFGDEVAGRREMLLTQVFIRIPPKVDPAAAVALVHRRLSAAHPVGIDPTLQKVAQQLATGLAAGKTRDEMWPSASKTLDALGAKYARVGSVVTAVADLSSVDGKELLGAYQPVDVGIGIAQGTHPEIGENAIWIVVLMAEPRQP